MKIYWIYFNSVSHLLLGLATNKQRIGFRQDGDGKRFVCNHKGPAQSVCVTVCNFIVNVWDLT